MPLQDSDFNRSYVLVREDETVGEALQRLKQAGGADDWHFFVRWKDGSFGGVQVGKLKGWLVYLGPALFERAFARLRGLIPEARTVDGDTVGIGTAEDWAQESPTSLLIVMRGEQIVGRFYRGQERGDEILPQVTMGQLHTDYSSIATDQRSEWKQPATPLPQDMAEMLAPLRRYADYTLYACVEDPGGERLERVPEGYALRDSQPYMLEVAVRETPAGILPDGTRQPIAEPAQTQDVTLYVTAESRDFDIAEPVQTLILPPRGDSTTNACFRIKPRVVTIDPRTRASITVCIYYEFNLLDEAVIEAEVVPFSADQARSRFGLDRPVSFRQVPGDGFMDLDHVLPRNMHIHISRQDERYFFHFTFWNEVDKKVDFTGLATPWLTADTLASALCDIRKILWGTAMLDVYGRQLDAEDDVEFAQQMQKLARLGRLLWTRLFEVDEDSAVWKIGQWLRTPTLSASFSTVGMQLRRA
jgi:hypothetical protein